MDSKQTQHMVKHITCLTIIVHVAATLLNWQISFKHLIQTICCWQTATCTQILLLAARRATGAVFSVVWPLVRLFRQWVCCFSIMDEERTASKDSLNTKFMCRLLLEFCLPWSLIKKKVSENKSVLRSSIAMTLIQEDFVPKITSNPKKRDQRRDKYAAFQFRLTF